MLSESIATQVATLADITTANCRFIEYNSLRCERCPYHTLPLTWICQPDVTVSQRQLWSSAIHCLFCVARFGASLKRAQPVKPLGAWLAAPQDNLMTMSLESPILARKAWTYWSPLASGTARPFVMNIILLILTRLTALQRIMLKAIKKQTCSLLHFTCKVCQLHVASLSPTLLTQATYKVYLLTIKIVCLVRPLWPLSV